MPRVSITVSENPPQPYRFQLDRQVVSLGRGSENDIVIDCGSASVMHAEMHRIQGGYQLRDLGSTNGITLDGVRQEVIPLTPGAPVKLGDVVFDFALSEDEITALAAEIPVPVAVFISDGEEEELPPPPATERIYPVRREGGGVGQMWLFLILLALAFFGGLMLRHHKETGESLIQEMRARFTAPAAPGVR